MMDDPSSLGKGGPGSRKHSTNSIFVREDAGPSFFIEGPVEEEEEEEEDEDKLEMGDVPSFDIKEDNKVGLPTFKT